MPPITKEDLLLTVYKLLVQSIMQSLNTTAPSLLAPQNGMFLFSKNYEDAVTGSSVELTVMLLAYRWYNEVMKLFNQLFKIRTTSNTNSLLFNKRKLPFSSIRKDKGRKSIRSCSRSCFIEDKFSQSSAPLENNNFCHTICCSLAVKGRPTNVAGGSHNITHGSFEPCEQEQNPVERRTLFHQLPRPSMA